MVRVMDWIEVREDGTQMAVELVQADGGMAQVQRFVQAAVQRSAEFSKQTAFARTGFAQPKPDAAGFHQLLQRNARSLQRRQFQKLRHLDFLGEGEGKLGEVEVAEKLFAGHGASPFKEKIFTSSSLHGVYFS
jgi:hypothetical protein